MSYCTATFCDFNPVAMQKEQNVKTSQAGKCGSDRIGLPIFNLGRSRPISVRLNAMANIPKTPTNYAQFPVCSRFVPVIPLFVLFSLGIVLAYGMWCATVSGLACWCAAVSNTRLWYATGSDMTHWHLVYQRLTSDTVACGIPQSRL